MKKILSVITWTIFLTIPLIDIGGLLACNGLVIRAAIAIVMYITGIIFGLLVGYLWGGGFL